MFYVTFYLLTFQCSQHYILTIYGQLIKENLTLLLVNDFEIGDASTCPYFFSLQTF